MGRNVGVQHLRGVKANIPTLLAGEEYFATDTFQLFIGTAGGNQAVNIPLYSTAGVFQQKSHMVSGTVTIGSGGSTAVTLTGNAVFTSSTSYICLCVCTNAKHACQVIQTSGSVLTFMGAGGDTYNFIAIGF